MKWIDIAVLLVSIIIVYSVVYFQIKRHKKDSGGCGGGCSNCSMSDNCHSHKEKK